MLVARTTYRKLPEIYDHARNTVAVSYSQQYGVNDITTYFPVLILWTICGKDVIFILTKMCKYTTCINYYSLLHKRQKCKYKYNTDVYCQKCNWAGSTPYNVVHYCNPQPTWRARAPPRWIICVAFTYTSAFFPSLSLRLLFHFTLIHTLSQINYSSSCCNSMLPKISA